MKPKRTDLRITVTSTGTVAPEGRIEMKPPVPGRVDSVLVVPRAVAAAGRPTAATVMPV